MQALSAQSAAWGAISARRHLPCTRLHAQAAVRAASSNGSVPGADFNRPAAPSQPVEMLEMVVADDLRPMTNGEQLSAHQRGPTKRLVPAPHKSTPTVAARPPSPAPPPPSAIAASAPPSTAAASPAAPPSPLVNGTSSPTPNGGPSGTSFGTSSSSSSSGTNGSIVSSNGLRGAPSAPVPGTDAAGLNGSSSPGVAPPAMVQQLISLQSSNKLVTSELSAAQRQVALQQVELKQAKTELAARNAEVLSLKQDLAEKDGKLKAARTDALESKMRLQQKDVELKEAYAQLSEAVRDRSAMRSQLAQTHAELAETRAELEQLADDILAIKVLMDDEGQFSLDDPLADEAYASSASAMLAPSSAPLSSGSMSGGEDDALDVLESLAALSRQLAADAAEDDAIVQNLAASWAEEGKQAPQGGPQ